MGWGADASDWRTTGLVLWHVQVLWTGRVFRARRGRSVSTASEASAGKTQGVEGTVMARGCPVFTHRQMPGLKGLFGPVWSLRAPPVTGPALWHQTQGG